MEEKCFKVKKDYHIYNEYFDWWNNQENLSEKWKQFKRLTGIEAESFVPRRELYIIPTENDIKKFGKMLLAKDYGKGLMKFRANSSIQKDWEKFIDAYKVIVNKPDIIFDFLGNYCPCGRITSRLFHYKDDVYCSVSSEFINENTECPDGYEEIKKSEFYSIIETIENEQNKEE